MRTTTLALTLALAAALLFTGGAQANHHEGEWISLFDGKTLDGWKVNKENPDSFLVKDGMLAIESGRSHIFYDGEVGNHNFKNFELELEVMTTQGSNSGIYFHTEYQDSGWPSKGYEAQVNTTHSDWKKTGSLYNIEDNRDAPSKDGEWFTYNVKVQGKRIIITCAGKQIVDYTEPEDLDREGRVLSSGTIALQAHDPDSKTYYRNIKIKLLED